MKKPVYYRLINGNIPDVTSMSLSVKEIGIRDAAFIADKGFYSAANIAAMDSQNLYYIIPLKRDNKMINYEGFEKNDFKKSRNY